MTEVLEIPTGSTEPAGPALLALRPQWGSAAAIVDMVDTRLRPIGYRLIGVFGEAEPDALAVAGFREVDTLAWGHAFYVDDVSTRPGHRQAGHADRLMTWVLEEAGRRDCASVHLDSGVGIDRAAAHRLYLRHHLRISSHHFQRDLLG